MTENLQGDRTRTAVLGDSNRQNLRVLIVEDSEPIRRRLKSAIESIPGLLVCGEAGDVEEGRRLIGSERPDIVTLDLRMPGESGFNLLREAARCGFAERIVVVTNHSLPEYRRFCLERGCKAFFDKSKEFGDLLVALRDLARAHREKPSERLPSA